MTYVSVSAYEPKDHGVGGSENVPKPVYVIYEWSIRRKNCAICTQSTAIVANSIKEKKFLIGFLDIISKINAGQLEMIVLATLKRDCRG